MFAKLIGNPWFGVGVIFVWLASLAYVGYWQRGEGRALEQNTWQKALIQSETLYNARLNELNTSYRELENKRATEAQQLSLKYINEAKSNEARYQNNLSALRNNDLRLRDKYATCNSSSGGTVSKTGSDTSGVDAGAGIELSPELSRYLVSKFYEADSEVILLNRCIRQLKADRGE